MPSVLEWREEEMSIGFDRSPSRVGEGEDGLNESALPTVAAMAPRFRWVQSAASANGSDGVEGKECGLPIDDAVFCFVLQVLQRPLNRERQGRQIPVQYAAFRWLPLLPSEDFFRPCAQSIHIGG